MARKSKAAYFLVDASVLPPEVIEDAAAGGGEYGVKVVEEMHNGGARQPLYGVYYGKDEEKWDEAKSELGLDVSETSATDAAGRADALGDARNDPRTEAALRQAAEQKAAADADAIRTAEQAKIDEVLEGDSKADASSPNRAEPNVNIADSTLSNGADRKPTNKAKR